jgi:hypothetical protein
MSNMQLYICPCADHNIYEKNKGVYYIIILTSKRKEWSGDEKECRITNGHKE